jgi:hypothetical protein
MDRRFKMIGYLSVRTKNPVWDEATGVSGARVGALALPFTHKSVQTILAENPRFGCVIV